MKEVKQLFWVGKGKRGKKRLDQEKVRSIGFGRGESDVCPERVRGETWKNGVRWKAKCTLQGTRGGRVISDWAWKERGKGVNLPKGNRMWGVVVRACPGKKT